MFKINAQTLLTQLVNFHINRQTPLTRGEKENTFLKPCIVIPFTLEMEVCTDYLHIAEMNKIIKNMYLLCFGNTSVFYAERRGKIEDEFKFLNWTNTSNSCLCWCTDGLNFINDYYDNMRRTLQAGNPNILVDSRFLLGDVSMKVDKGYAVYSYTSNNDLRVIEIIM